MAARKRYLAEVSAANPSTSDFFNMDCDVLTTEDCSGSDDEEEEEQESCGVKCDLPPEFNNYWKTAMERPDNFSAWIKLVAFAESKKNLAACRKAYDAFLMHFPLCHIYWKKYADLELQHGNVEETEKVFVRAVKSIPLHVTMWMNYIEYLQKSMKMTLPKSVDKLRGVFKEAVKASGMVFHSDLLWKTYIEFEIQQKNLKDVTALFYQVLTIPTQQYYAHFQRFKTFVSSHSPVEILNTEEYNWIRSRIQLESDDALIAAEDTDDVESLTDSDIATFQKCIIQIREQLYLLNKTEVKNRRTFEGGIKRLYFYAAPINVKQLQNWRKYLAFEVSKGQHERIVLLYERCLMTCSLYEEFWLLYIQYMEQHSVEAARSVYERACRIHLPLKHSLHLQWAAFEEKHGCLDSARAILCRLENVIPGLAIIRLRRVGLEQRNGNLQEAERLLKEAVQISATPELAGFYSVKLSRFILKLQRNPGKAKAVLDEALLKNPYNPKLYLCMLELEMSKEDAPLVYVERALKHVHSNDSKKILSQRRLEFIEDFGSSLTSWMNAYNEHQTFLKRKGDDGTKDEDVKKVKTDSISEDCYPPGVTPPPPPPPPTDLKSGVPPKEESTDNASAPANSVSTVTVSVAGNRATAAVSSSSVPSFSRASAQTIALCQPTSELNQSSDYHTRPHVQPYFHPQRYEPPQNVPMQPLFGNQYPQPIENFFPNFQQHMLPGPPQGPFNGHPGPMFIDNSGMAFGMPNIFGCGPWFQNYGADAWNSFFPPQ